MRENNSDHKIMFDSDNYGEVNSLQKAHALKTLKEYSPQMLWRKNGQDTVLDIGCAEGTVTREVVAPLLPKNYKMIVGIDSNEDSVKSASKMNKNKRIKFETVDISGDLNLNFPPFDHITSFLCLHWIENQKKAFENIYNLLADGGDCLFTIVPNHNYQKVTKIMSLMEKWRHCFKDHNLAVAPFRFVPNPEQIVTKIMNDLGFKYHKVEMKPWTYDHGVISDFREFVKLFNPIDEHLTEKEYERYIDEYLEILWILDNDPSKSPKTRGHFMTVYGRK